MGESQYKRLSSRDTFPCYKDGVQCTKRHLGCHSTCPDYAKAKIKNDARKDVERKKRYEISDVNRFKVSQAAKSSHSKPGEK